MTTRGDAAVTEFYSTETLTRHRLLEFGISLEFVLRVRTLLDHSKKNKHAVFNMLTSVHKQYLSILLDKGGGLSIVIILLYFVYS